MLVISSLYNYPIKYYSMLSSILILLFIRFQIIRIVSPKIYAI